MLGFIDKLIAALIVPLAVWLGKRRLAKGLSRSLWGATPILTLPLKARADRLLGIEARTLVFQTYYISRNFDFNLQKPFNGLAKLAPRLLPLFDRAVLCWALCRFDIFHYFYDRGLMRPATRFGVNPLELALLKSAGRRIYLYAYGADVRLRQRTLALGRWNFCAECPEPTVFCACDDTEYAPLLAEMSRQATAATALGDMLVYVPDVRNLHYWPIDTGALPPAPAPRLDGPLRIAHAPNHTHFKGSHYLERAIETLRGEGHAIEYVKVQGVANAEVIRLFGAADLVADQFIGGAYGYTALEAMARGKPVISFVRSPDLVEAGSECPLLNATPDTLEETLRWCLTHRQELVDIGAAGVAYVARWHSINAVAGRMAQLYLDTADFDAAISARLERSIADETARRDTIVARHVDHPYRITPEGCARLETRACAA